MDAQTLRLHVLGKYGLGVITFDKINVKIAFSFMEEKQIPKLFDLVLKGFEDLRARGQ